MLVLSAPSPPPTVEAWMRHTPLAQASTCPSGAPHWASSRPGSILFTRPASWSPPFSTLSRKGILYHTTVSPLSRAAGWDKEARLYWVLEFSKLVPVTQQAAQRRTRDRVTATRTMQNT